MGKKIFDRTPEERVFNFFKDLVRSFNPDSYHDLTVRSIWEGIKYLIKLTLLAAIIMSLILCFQIFSLKNSLDDELDKLETLELQGELTETIEIEQHKITLANAANYTDENILITKDKIVRKPLYCLLLSPTCIFGKEPIETEYPKLHEHKEAISDLLFWMTIIMFPGIMLLFSLYFFVKALTIIILLSVLASMIIRALKFEIRFSRVFLCAIFSSTAFIIAEPINAMIISLWYIPVIFSFLLFTVCLILLCEKKHRYRDV